MGVGMRLVLPGQYGFARLLLVRSVFAVGFVIGALAPAHAVPLPGTIDLSVAPGSEASPVLRVYGGIAGDALGAGGPNGVAYGDINGDGLDDLIVGAPGASPMSRTDAGEVVVIYGSAALPATQLDLVASPGTLGETHIVGAAAGNETGTSVAAADLNGDGFDDILIGASGVSTEKGAAYIIYGSASKPGAASGTGSVLDLSDAVGANGETRINGFQDGARLGNALAAGDVNGDGYDDLIIGSHYSDGTAGMDSGEAYIVYGGAVKPGTVALSGSVVVLETPGASGDTRIRADDAGDYLGESVTAGDINGDGYDDVIVGATGSNTAGSNAGEAFVIYGGSTKPGAAELSGSILDLGSAVGSNGETRIRGAGEGDGVAGSLASGDVNADGYDDLIIGAPQTEKPLPDTEGLAYVLYGAPVKLGTPTGSGSVVNFSDSAGSYGETRIIGAVDGMLTGSSVGAGDVNGDGFDDVVVGARFASPGGRTQAGTVSLVFGGLVKPGVAAGAGSVLDLASASPGVAVLGADVGGGLGFGAVAGGDMDSDGFSECVTAAPDGSPSSRAGAGYVAAVFGQGDAETAEASEAFAAGDTGLRGFGGRLSPTVRAWLSFADGAAGIATATLTRNNDGIAPFGGRADVVWNLSTTRTGYTEASIRLQYLDSEVAALDEETLRLMQAPAPEGPWSEVPDPLFSPSRNEVRANVSEFGYFTLQGVKNSVVVDTLTDVADGDTSSIAALLLDRGTDTFISLREAITAANNTAGHDEIIFAGPIAGGVILPGSALPALNDLDGATLRGPITIDGQDVVSPGITLAGFNELADLSVVRFLTGVYIFGESNLVQGCRIGVDASEAAAGNRYGIDIQNGQHNIIFGNVVSGNAEYGVLVRAGTAMGNTIAGNFIGVDSSGQVVIPNNVGIYVSDSANVIGPDNVVRGNITDGIQFLGPAFHNAITGNLITENGGAGIVLLDGANGGIQPPLIEALTEDIMPGFAAVSGSAAPNATVDFFADPDDEGVVHLGSATADGAGEFATLLDVSDVIGLNLTAIQTDGAGNSSAFSVPKAIDFTPPQIVLVGNGMISLQCGDPYVDPGATATDDVDGDISGGIVIDSLAVDTATLGDYLVTYNVTDAAGNAANQITRTVQVRDNTVPIIQLLGPSEITVACGEVYVDPGATASDSCAGDLSGGIVIGGSAVDTATLGDYLVTYNVTDAAGNAANQITRVVQVRDNTVPIIQLLGPSEITVACGEVYVDPGATASDSCAGDLSGGIVIGGSAVDTATPGDYIVTYNVTDVTGNVANQVNRTVHVVDITLPIITLNDSDDITINCGDAYTDAGVASATDECAGVLGATLFSSDVNTTTPGDYTVVYRTTDGTNTVDKTRNVHVVDSDCPGDHAQRQRGGKR
jgi:hypothetical protein